MPTQLSRRRLLALLGVSGAALTTTLNQVKAQSSSDGQVLDVAVIGAGAAGLTAGFLLNKAGARFEVFEAASIVGGRAKKHVGWADFPLDLGGEWIHTTNKVLNTLSQTNTAAGRALEWRPVTCDLVSGGQVSRENRYALDWRGEHRFTSTTWFDFFNDYMANGIRDRIRLNAQVASIDYSGGMVTIGFRRGRTVRARHVIVTVPLYVLKDGDIRFTPALPRAKMRAMNGAIMPDGFKLFMRFKEKFYPDMVLFDHGYATPEAEIMYYNVALDKPTRQNILGLFAHGVVATPFVGLSDDALVREAIKRLDAIYNGAASRNYQSHVLQNWSKSPFHRGTYSFYKRSRPSKVGAPIDDKVFFAGEAYNQRWDGEWGYMHVASRSAYDAVEAISKV
ncbi:MAG: NAD(P)/FAD-dependent oxidoreductase [Pseudomonadota bacterium]